MKRLAKFLLLFAAPPAAQTQTPDTAAILQKIDSLVQVNRKLADEKKYPEAFAAIESAEKLTLETVGKNHAAWATCLFNRGRTFDFEERHGEAEPFYLEAKALFEKTLGKENARFAGCLYNLAKMYGDEKRYQDAEPIYRECLEIRAKILGKDDPGYASALKNLGATYYLEGKFDLAEPLFLENFEITERKSGKETRAYAASAKNLSVLYQALGDYEKAQVYGRESLEIWEKLVGKERIEYGESLMMFANLQWRMGNFEQAEALFLQAKNIAEKTVGKNDKAYASALNGLGVVYWNLGNFEQAEPLFLEAKAIEEKIGGAENYDYAGKIINLGLLYSDMKKYEQAEIMLLEAKNLFENQFKNAEHPFYQNCLNNLANLYRSTRKFEKGEALHRQTLAIREEKFGKNSATYAESLHNLASLYLDWGKPALAEKLFLEAKTIHEKTLGKAHPHQANTLFNLAKLYRETGQNQKAETCFSEADALEKQRMLQASRHLSEVEMMAYVQKFSGRLEQSFSFAQAASSPGFWGNAFDNALFFKGFQLFSTTQFRNRVSQKPELAERFAALTACHRRLAKEYAKPISERQNTPELEAKANEIEKELTHSVAGFGQAVRQVAWQEVQAALLPGDVAIEFVHFQYRNPHLTDSVFYAALVLLPVPKESLWEKNEPPVWVKLFEEKQLTRLTPNEQTPASVNAFYQKPELQKLLWQPLEKHLAGAKRIFYSPSGLLAQIAFPAIQTLDNHKLIERFDLHCLGSTRQLVFEKSPSEFVAGSEAALFGGIQFDMDSAAIAAANLEISPSGKNENLSPGTFRGGAADAAWQYLKWSEIEVGEISDLLAGAGARPIVRKGFAASEEAFLRLNKPKILHFATHAFYFSEKNAAGKNAQGEPVFKISEQPMMRSGLALAGANQVWTGGKTPQNMEDGILTAYEISQTNLSGTELAVLSACESGLGQIEGQEGVYGLARAFKIAGVRHLLISLWPVSDYETEELMAVFYSEWLRGGVAVSEAFRAAQLKLLAQFPGEASAWAGFVLVE